MHIKGVQVQKLNFFFWDWEHSFFFALMVIKKQENVVGDLYFIFITPFYYFVVEDMPHLLLFMRLLCLVTFPCRVHDLHWYYSDMQPLISCVCWLSIIFPSIQGCVLTSVWWKFKWTSMHKINLCLFTAVLIVNRLHVAQGSIGKVEGLRWSFLSGAELASHLTCFHLKTKSGIINNYGFH